MSLGITLVGATATPLGLRLPSVVDGEQTDEVVVSVTISPLSPGQHGNEPEPPTPIDPGGTPASPGQCVSGCAQPPSDGLAATGGDPTTIFVWVSLALVAAGVVLLVRRLDGRRTAARVPGSRG